MNVPYFVTLKMYKNFVVTRSSAGLLFKISQYFTFADVNLNLDTVNITIICLHTYYNTYYCVLADARRL